MIIQDLKSTLNNFWFWASVVFFISTFVTELIIEINRERENFLREYTSKCPDGFTSWENTEFETTDKFERKGDTLLYFEKRIESGCRPFDFSRVPRATVDSLIRVHNVIHYTWIDGLVNLSEGILLNADTMRSEKPHKYR